MFERERERERERKRERRRERKIEIVKERERDHLKEQYQRWTFQIAIIFFAMNHTLHDTCISGCFKKPSYNLSMMPYG